MLPPAKVYGEPADVPAIFVSPNWWPGLYGGHTVARRRMIPWPALIIADAGGEGFGHIYVRQSVREGEYHVYHEVTNVWPPELPTKGAKA